MNKLHTDKLLTCGRNILEDCAHVPSFLEITKNLILVESVRELKKIL